MEHYMYVSYLWEVWPHLVNSDVLSCHIPRAVKAMRGGCNLATCEPIRLLEPSHMTHSITLIGQFGLKHAAVQGIEPSKPWEMFFEAFD